MVETSGVADEMASVSYAGVGVLGGWLGMLV